MSNENDDAMRRLIDMRTAQMDAQLRRMRDKLARGDEQLRQFRLDNDQRAEQYRQAIHDEPDDEPPAPPQIQDAQQPAQPHQYTAEEIAAVKPGSPKHLALRRQFGLDRARGKGLLD